MTLEPTAHNDDSLLRLIKRGDENAATTVFERHAPRLLAVAGKRLSDVLKSRVDPEDIVQSTFKSFFRRAANGGYTAPKAGDLFNLLVVIAMRKINAKASYHQTAGRDVRRTLSASAEGAVEQSDNQQQAMLQELCMTVAELLEDFSESQRTIIQYRLEGFTVEEISEKLTRSRRTVERELQSFRERLSKEFAP